MDTPGVRHALLTTPRRLWQLASSLGEHESDDNARSAESCFSEIMETLRVLREVGSTFDEAAEHAPERLSLEDAFFELTDSSGPVPNLLGAAS